MVARNALWFSPLGALLFFICTSATAEGVPPYEHILVIIAENHAYRQIIGSANAPNLNRLATTYGSATHFYGEVHPSEGNYVAMIGGDTFGIHDDDAWYCRPGKRDRYCSSAKMHKPYVNHTVTARSLVDQLYEHNLTWKGYFESIPAAGSKIVYSSDANSPVAGEPERLYASKHNGFLNFRTVQNDPALASKLVGFDQLIQDLVIGQVPNYAHIVPNQCNEMHGLGGHDVPDDCKLQNDDGRVARGDRAINDLVTKIVASPIWSARANAAIVITWDEDNDPKLKVGTQGCCGFDPNSKANFGGGHIPTLVITNHGARSLTDDTPYNHYSLLRTTEEALGINEYLGHANDSASGVKPMTSLLQLQ
jgi:hypothetical protein